MDFQDLLKPIEEEYFEKTLPISWKGWDKQDELVNTYYNVEFTDNFGVFMKGEKFSCITVNYGKGNIKSYDDSGSEVTKTQNYKSIPSD